MLTIPLYANGLRYLGITDDGGQGAEMVALADEYAEFRDRRLVPAEAIFACVAAVEL